MSERLPKNILGWLQRWAKASGNEPQKIVAIYVLSLIEELEADSDRLDKLDSMSPATLGEVLCRLSKQGAEIRNVIDKLEEH